jgi:hypothetical protein
MMMTTIRSSLEIRRNEKPTERERACGVGYRESAWRMTA